MLQSLRRIQALRLSGARFVASADTERPKSILEKDYDQKEKWVVEDENSVERKLTPREKKIEEDKKRLRWRKTFDEDQQIWRSKFNAFNSGENDMTMMMLLQQPWDFRPRNLRRIYSEYQVKKEAYEQSFIEARMKVLGPDLAIAHFITYRNGKVRFQGTPTWSTNSDLEKLPRTYDPAYLVEAINFDSHPLHYEGVENFRHLVHCKSISLRNCRFFDDWCLDRLSGCQLPVLEELDIAESDVTHRGFGVIYRFSSLRRLIIDKQKKDSIEWQLTFAMLEDMNPKLEVLDSKDVAQT